MVDGLNLTVRLIEETKITEVPLPLPLLYWPSTIWHKGKIFAHLVNGHYSHVDCLVLEDAIEVSATLVQQQGLKYDDDNSHPF
jgi:hypothetical protein